MNKQISSHSRLRNLKNRHIKHIWILFIPQVKSPGEFTVSAVHYPVQPMDQGNCYMIYLKIFSCMQLMYLLSFVILGGVVCVSGAGDCFAAAFISSALRAASQDEAVAAGIQVGP